MNKHRTSPSRFWNKRLGWIFLALFLAIGAFLVGYFLGFDQAEAELEKERQQTARLIRQIQDIAALDEKTVFLPTGKEARQEAEIRRLKEELREMLGRQKAPEPKAPKGGYAPKEPKAPPPPEAKRSERPAPGAAKLVIIIDDVSYEKDVRAIRSTGLPLVMSFLPPSPRHPQSAALAKREPFYMVHLPLEALAFHDEEPHTLRIDSSEEEIESRIHAIKQLYPKVRYINNHTGSKFTSDMCAMDKLVRILKKEGIQFVDSRTIGKTKGREATAKHGMRYLGRDVFLDDQDGVKNVKAQIAEAVRKAKQNGTAIAIGHPRPDTIRALKESKELLREVELVGIDQI